MRKRKSEPGKGKKLSLLDAVGMAIGGMVGGGIFAVLGEAAIKAGNAAFLSFGLAGALALITGASYCRLTLYFDEPGGSFSYLSHLVNSKVAGTLSWFLILGYLFTVSLYAYTFGAYSGQLFGLEDFRGYLGGAIIVLLAVVNQAGVRATGFTEDLLVYGKIAILLAVGAVAWFAVEPEEMQPVFEHGTTSIFAAAALIFVAYEGFQLLTYDYDDIADHGRNFPRAIWISIPVVTLIYMLIAFVTTGSLADHAIAENRETVLAYVAKPVLGRAAMTVVLIAAVMSTASAINATMFATSRLAERIAREHQLPRAMVGLKVGGMPVVFLWCGALFSFLVQFFGNLHQITAFSSLLFLLVFSAVNLLAFVHRVHSGWMLLLPAAGLLGCLSAAAILIRELYFTEQNALPFIAAIVAVLGILRAVYTKINPPSARA